MPIPLRPPSRVDSVSFPVFGMCWVADPSNHRSVLAYCGGGGSAKTGVNNRIMITDSDNLEDVSISTGDAVGVAIQIFVNGKQFEMLVSLGKTVARYTLPDGQLLIDYQVPSEESCSALAVMADQLAIGCESGAITIHNLETFEILASCKGHTKAISALHFSNSLRLASSAKDGTARVWNNGEPIGGALNCECPDPKAKGSILVRGCGFLDLNGDTLATIASARRGKAFLSRWRLQSTDYVLHDRLELADAPVSAMNLSLDAVWIAFGTVSGTVILWNVEDWTSHKVFREVHDLPVTCIAARPFGVPLYGEEDGVNIHVRSASADSRMGCLSLQKRAPRKPKPSGSGTACVVWIHRLLVGLVLSYILAPIGFQAYDLCEPVWSRHENAELLLRCIVDEVFWAPPDRPGVSEPPH